MRKLVLALIVGGLTVGLGMAPAFAQSSGNFTASVTNTTCQLSSSDGSLTGGTTPPSSGTLTATIKLPNSSPALLVTPSLETGLYTNTATSSETAAIVVVVQDQFGGVTTTLSPSNTCVDTTPAPATASGCSKPSSTCACGVAYDERFLFLNTSLNTPQTMIDLVQSTLSAHSFNFVEGQVAGGTHNIVVSWFFGCDSGTGHLTTQACAQNFMNDSAGACTGPGTLTVQQVQNFQQDSIVQSTGP